MYIYIYIYIHIYIYSYLSMGNFLVLSFKKQGFGCSNFKKNTKALASFVAQVEVLAGVNYLFIQPDLMMP